MFEALRWFWTRGVKSKKIRKVRLLPGVYPLVTGDVLLLAKASEDDEQLEYRVCRGAIVVERLLTGEIVGVILGDENGTD